MRPSSIDPVGNVVQSGFIEQGLLSLAFDPKFKDNNYFYVHYSSARQNGASVIARYEVDPDSPNAVTAEQARKSEKVLMIVEQPSHNNNGGEIQFGPDGYLYIGLGDGGWASPENASQKTSTRLGKILRIDVDSSEPYRVPKDNPFAEDGEGAAPEIWAYGFHNPYKFSFDKDSGAMFVADVGDGHWEEINYIDSIPAKENNFGWPHMEGSYCFDAMEFKKTSGCNMNSRLPIAQYKHPIRSSTKSDKGEVSCASVQGFGVAERGKLDGAYLFGDWCSGKIFGVGWDADKNEWQMETLLETKLHVTAGGLDEQGNVLLLSAKFYQDDQNPDKPPYGTIWRISEK